MYSQFPSEQNHFYRITIKPFAKINMFATRRSPLAVHNSIQPESIGFYF